VVVIELEREWPGCRQIDTRRLRDGEAEDRPDAVAVEHFLTIVWRGRRVVTLACTPREEEELVAGYLFGRGELPPAMTPDEAGFKCTFSPDRRVARADAASLPEPARPDAGDAGGERGYSGFVTAGCGAGLVWDQARLLLETPPVDWSGTVQAARLGRLARALQDSPLFRLTGGTHSAAAARTGDDSAPGTTAASRDECGRGLGGAFIVRCEDIGRHNAVDKVVGHLWLKERLGEPYILATSGRVSSDVALKAARAGLPVVLSRGAPTDAAVEIARHLGVTLVGFARGSRLNVYSGFEHVTP